MEILGLVDNPLIWMLLPLALCLLYVYSTWTFSTWSSLGVPGPKPSIIFGNMDTYRKLGMTDAVDRWTAEYGPTFGMYFARTPVLVTTDLDILKEVFVKQFNNFHLRNLLPHTMHCGLMDKMLFVSNGETWRRHRYLMSSTFSAGKLRGLMDHINRCGKIAVDVFSEMASKKANILLKEKLSLLTMDFAAAALMGLDLNFLRDPDRAENQPLIQVMQDFGAPLAPDTFPRIAVGAFPFLAPLCRAVNVGSIPDKDIAALRSCVVDAMRHKRNNSTQSKKQVDFLQHLMNMLPKPGHEVKHDKGDATGHDDKYLTEEEVIAEAMGVMIDGCDTTGNVFRFMLYSLTTNPDEQRKVYDEIQRVIGEGDVTYESAKGLKYLEKVIMETVRLYPPAPFLTRQALETVTIKGVTIPKDTIVFIPLYNILRDPANFQDPDSFRPDRREETTDSMLHLLPFGSGPRKCIGMRLALLALKTLTVHLIRKLKFVHCEETVKAASFSRSALLSTDKPLVVRAELRQ